MLFAKTEYFALVLGMIRCLGLLLVQPSLAFSVCVTLLIQFRQCSDTAGQGTQPQSEAGFALFPIWELRAHLSGASQLGQVLPTSC